MFWEVDFSSAFWRWYCFLYLQKSLVIMVMKFYEIEQDDIVICKDGYSGGILTIQIATVSPNFGSG